MFVNSERPQFKKAREVAVAISNHEAAFLDHESFIDTTKLQISIPDDLIDEALSDEDRLHGFLAPSLRRRIVDEVASHEVMEPDQRAAVLEGELDVGDAITSSAK